MGTSRDLAMAQISKALAEIGMSYGGGALSASLADSAKGMISQAARKKREKEEKKKKGSGLAGTLTKLGALIPGPQQPFMAAAALGTSAYDAGVDIVNKDYLSAGLNVAGVVGGASNISKGLNRGADGLGAVADPVTGAVTQSTADSGLSAITSKGQALTKAGRFSSGLGVVAPKRHSMEFRNTDPGGPFSGFPVGAVANLPEGIGSPTRDLQLKDNLDPNILPAGTRGDPDRTLDNRTLKARLQDARQRGMPLTSQLGMVGERVAQRLGGGPKWQEFSRQVGQQLPTMISQAQSQKSSTPGAGDVVGMGYQAVADMNREKIQQKQFTEQQDQRKSEVSSNTQMQLKRLKVDVDNAQATRDLTERIATMKSEGQNDRKLWDIEAGLAEINATIGGRMAVDNNANVPDKNSSLADAFIALSYLRGEQGKDVSANRATENRRTDISEMETDAKIKLDQDKHGENVRHNKTTENISWAELDAEVSRDLNNLTIEEGKLAYQKQGMLLEEKIHTDENLLKTLEYKFGVDQFEYEKEYDVIQNAFKNRTITVDEGMMQIKDMEVRKKSQVAAGHLAERIRNNEQTEVLRAAEIQAKAANIKLGNTIPLRETDSIFAGIMGPAIVEELQKMADEGLEGLTPMMRSILRGERDITKLDAVTLIQNAPPALRAMLQQGRATINVAMNNGHTTQELSTPKAIAALFNSQPYKGRKSK